MLSYAGFPADLSVLFRQGCEITLRGAPRPPSASLSTSSFHLLLSDSLRSPSHIGRSPPETQDPAFPVWIPFARRQ